MTDDEFIELWRKTPSASQMAEVVGVNVRNVHNRRRRIEQSRKIQLLAADPRTGSYYKDYESGASKARHQITVKDGVAVIFSDAHFLPGVRTTAFRGLLHLLDLKPSIVVNNGDAFDGGSISRHPRIGWDHTPTVQEELRACEERLAEIREAAGDAKLVWPMGNHDERFETFLAAHAPQYEGVKGFSLHDRFPEWTPCWGLFVNQDVVIKHKWKSGTHATHNNAVGAGRTVVTGHLHSLKVTPVDDYNGTRWGVDTGMLADPLGPQFESYLESNPTNWRSGFVVLTWVNGRLLWPELVRVFDFDHIEFRGQIIDVSKD